MKNVSHEFDCVDFYCALRDIIWFVLMMPAMKGNYIEGAILSTIYGLASVSSGIGLLRYRLWAHSLALLVLIPLIPGFVGIIGLYYLYRKTARQIFNEPVMNL